MLFGKISAPELNVEGNSTMYSSALKRQVVMELFLPSSYPYSRRKYSLLLLNDGQDTDALRLKSTLSRLTRTNQMQEIIVCAVYAGDRMQEYGVSGHPDFKKRGAKAKAYSRFITHELIPLLDSNFRIDFNSKVNAIAGCSLGGLSAFDICWHHPEIFQRAGVFSGSLWWRNQPYGDGFDEMKHRILHNLIKGSSPRTGIKFWLQTGTLDETADRNKNGIIDSIDDTLDIIVELTKKGLRPYRDIEYVEIKNGKHNQQTWAKALPMFLKWCFPL